MQKTKAAEQDDLQTFAEQLEIEEDNLVSEWIEQPKKYLVASRYAARCVAELAAAEVACKVVESKLALKFRANGLGDNVKVTEEAIKNAVRTNAEWIKAETRRVQCVEKEMIALGLQNAFAQRERSLKWLSHRQWAPTGGEGCDTPKDIVKAAHDITKAALYGA